MNVIEIKNLTKYYGEQKGIENVSLEVKEGEIFGFIGPNGAGKSTTIRTILSLIFPTSGSATIFGKDCFEHGKEIRKNVGYLPSEIFYYDKMKVIDLLKYTGKFYNKDCTKRMYELAEIMELDLNRKIEDLSYGNKKKVGIVQGLLHEPKLIILDEPTSGLDPLMQKKFFEIIVEENKKGATIFFSSHILKEVQDICTRVAIIKDGAIIKVDSVKALRGENYKRVIIRSENVDSKVFKIDGVSQLKAENGRIEFFYNGKINEITGLIASLDIDDLIIEELSLEEIFMHYYK